MTLILVAIGIAMACVMVLRFVKRGRNRSELERHSLSAEQLESLMASGQKVYLFDVRQPLDLLAYPELIPGAKRISPEEVLRTPSLLPRDEDIVLYCTCPGDKTSLSVCIARWHLGSHGSSSSPEVWRPGKGKGIVWNLTASPFGFRFQLWLRPGDDHRGLSVDVIK